VRRNARDWHGRAEHDDDVLVDRDGYLSEDVGEVQGYDETPSGQLAMGNGIQIAIVRPRNFRDAATVGEYYRQEIPVIINLENMDNVDATRIIDFVSGLILGLGGDIERISRRAFLIVPADATIVTTHNGLTEEGFFNQALRRAGVAPVWFAACGVGGYRGSDEQESRFLVGDGAVLSAARDDEQFAWSEFDAAVPHLDGETALDEKEHFLLVFMGVPVRRADPLGHLEQVAVAAREHPLGPELRQSRCFIGQVYFFHGADPGRRQESLPVVEMPCAARFMS
jgi:cell division inhibitor SepF